jgi:hypothetical protein
MKIKYTIEDQLYILHENRIRLCIVNEIIKKPDSVRYNVLIDGFKKNETESITSLLQEKNIHKSVDDLPKSLVDDFKMSLNDR